MALGGAPNIGWDENSPADSESASLGNERMQSIKTSVRQALDSEHIFSASGGTLGAHRPGSAKPFVGLQSAVSSADTDGRMMWTSDTSRLFHVGSSGKNYIGGARALSLGSTPAIQTTHHWVEEFGYVSITGLSGSSVVTIPNSGYSGAPVVFAQQNESTGSGAGIATAGIISIYGISATTFTIVASGTGGNTATIVWRSLGSRVL